MKRKKNTRLLLPSKVKANGPPPERCICLSITQRIVRHKEFVRRHSQQGKLFVRLFFTRCNKNHIGVYRSMIGELCRLGTFSKPNGAVPFVSRARCSRDNNRAGMRLTIADEVDDSSVGRPRDKARPRRVKKFSENHKSKVKATAKADAELALHKMQGRARSALALTNANNRANR